MKIKQVEDKSLSHYSYVVWSECASKIAVIDPARDVSTYLDFAKENGAKITAIIETHPHADFVSGHLELQRATGATIYCSKLQQTGYESVGFDEGDIITIGKIRLKAINTPGHSPDSICIVLEHEGRDKAVFTGDTLFIGDCGRPDLRESAGNVAAKRDELARQMYHSLRDKLAPLPGETIVYPAHGAGTLCGKSLSSAKQSTMGKEKEDNWSLQSMEEAAFVEKLTTDQPFVPKYFGYDVNLNLKGAPDRSASIAKVPILLAKPPDVNTILVVDTRKEAAYKEGHTKNSINIQQGTKLETWLGTLVAPEEPFYLTAENKETLEAVIGCTTRIGYEPFIKAAFVLMSGPESIQPFDLNEFKGHEDAYTIVDVRSPSEAKEKPAFTHALNIPLYDLRERVGEIPTSKPVVVHCASGYRSAAASSIIATKLQPATTVMDMGDHIKEFLK